MEIKEIARGEGLMELRVVPDGDPMEVKRIHIRKRKKMSDSAEVILIIAIAMAVMGMLFGTVLVQYESAYVLYWVVTLGLAMLSSYLSGFDRGKKKSH